MFIVIIFTELDTSPLKVMAAMSVPDLEKHTVQVITSPIEEEDEDDQAGEQASVMSETFNTTRQASQDSFKRSPRSRSRPSTPDKTLSNSRLKHKMSGPFSEYESYQNGSKIIQEGSIKDSSVDEVSEESLTARLKEVFVTEYDENNKPVLRLNKEKFGIKPRGLQQDSQPFTIGKMEPEEDDAKIYRPSANWNPTIMRGSSKYPNPDTASGDGDIRPMPSGFDDAVHVENIWDDMECAKAIKRKFFKNNKSRAKMRKKKTTSCCGCIENSVAPAEI